MSDSNWLALLSKEQKNSVNVCCIPEGAKGKGVFAKKSFIAGDVVIIEVPICQHVRISCLNEEFNSKCCNHCLYRKLQTEEFKLCEPKKVFDTVYESMYPDKSVSVNCDKCFVLYCSDTCKNTAWNQYHRFLCSRSKQSESSYRSELYSKAK